MARREEQALAQVAGHVQGNDAVWPGWATGYLRGPVEPEGHPRDALALEVHEAGLDAHAVLGQGGEQDGGE
ncbi:MAG: hypothetical protein O2816_16895 [Planctomycetota bacterium]|nr:hypothetical protein [Planctomycetota bacterium]